jgi:hypothetical protein
VSGDRSLTVAPSWGSGGFTVQERGSLALAYVTVLGDLTVLGGAAASLSGCALGVSVGLTTSDGGSLSLSSTSMPFGVLVAAQAQLSGAGSTLRLTAVTVPDQPSGGVLTGTATVQADGSKASDPPDWGRSKAVAFFIVSSGPCTVSDGGRCVGRPGGYTGGDRERGEGEACAIVVGGGGGVLGACGIFDTNDGNDIVTLPDGSAHRGSDCPVGAVLAPGDSVRWAANIDNQGNQGAPWDNGCADNGLCGLPYSHSGLGGGWQICFE